MSQRVQLAVRINPNSADNIFEPAEPLETGDGYRLTIKGATLDKGEVGTKQRQFDGKFDVDHVFEGGASQEDVWGYFEDQVLGNVLDAGTGQARFGVTIMAYGQTGSGKTFTMMGPEDCKAKPLDASGGIKENAGIIMRIAHSLFQRIGEYASSFGAKTTCTLGLLELYNEEMYDLLVDVPGKDLKK